MVVRTPRSGTDTFRKMSTLFGDLTEEELRAQSEAFGDFEFKREILNEGGDLSTEAIRDSEFEPILFEDDTNFNLLGFTIPEETRQLSRERDAAGDTGIVDRSVDKRQEIFEEANIPIDEGRASIQAAMDRDEPTIFTIGTEGNNPEVLSHEVRHAAFDIIENTKNGTLDTARRNKALAFMKKNIPNTAGEETFNRQFDMYRDRDGSSFSGAAREVIVNASNRAINTNKGLTIEKMKEIGKKEIDRQLDVVKKNSEKFANLEAAAQVMKGNPSPKGLTWKEFYLKQYLARQTNVKKRSLILLEGMFK